MKSTKSSAAAAVARLAAIDAKCKTLYDERDLLETGLIAQIERTRGREIPLPGGQVVTLKDNFLDRDGNPRNVAFKTAAVKRFEIVIR